MALINKTAPRPKENENPLQSGRKTTLIDPASPPGTPGYDGPPQKALEDHVNYLEGLDRVPLHLVGALTEEQIQQDAAYCWSGVTEYCEATAGMMARAPHLFRPQLHYTGQNLEQRMRRIGLLARATTQHAMMQRLFQDALIAEVSDLSRMSDTAVSIIEHVRNSPMLSPGDRQNLDAICEGPLGIWRDRQAGILEQRRQNKRAKEKTDNAIEQAMQEALAERIYSRIRTGERPTDDEVRLAAEHANKVATHAPPHAPPHAGRARTR
jgi:hypothetical protein